MMLLLKLSAILIFLIVHTSATPFIPSLLQNFHSPLNRNQAQGTSYIQENQPIDHPRYYEKPTPVCQCKERTIVQPVIIQSYYPVPMMFYQPMGKNPTDTKSPDDCEHPKRISGNKQEHNHPSHKQTNDDAADTPNQNSYNEVPYSANEKSKKSSIKQRSNISKDEYSGNEQSPGIIKPAANMVSQLLGNFGIGI